MSSSSSPFHDSAARVDEGAFRRALGCFATGVTVVTTTVDAGLHGMTANAFSSVSLDPPLVLVCVDRGAQMHGYLQESRSFAVTVLGDGQAHVSDRFASSGREARGFDQFEGQAWEPGPLLGHPVLTEGLAYLECEVSAAYPGGDHTIVVGAVRSTGLLEGEHPLAYFSGRYWRLDGLPDGRSRGS